MLDLNYVRENLDSVRAALEKRGIPGAALDDFAQADSIRRRAIAESNQINASANAASREIGALIKEGKHEEAEERRREIAFLKESVVRRNGERAAADTRM